MPGTFWFILSDDGDRLPRVLQGDGRLLVAGTAEVDAVHLGRGERLSGHSWGPGSGPRRGRAQGRPSLTAFPHREDLVPLPQFPAEVCGTACQDEGDEDALAVLAAHDVETQARGAPVDDDPSRVPGHVLLPKQVLGHWGVAPRGSWGHGRGVVGTQVTAVTDLVVQVLGIG